MNLMDKVIIKDGEEFVENIFFLEVDVVEPKYIFTSEANLVYDEDKAVLWKGSVGSKALRVLRNDLDYVQVDDATYELNIAEYKHGPKTMHDLF
jgi:hypothetical protein